jgi:hypothetical protein
MDFTELVDLASERLGGAVRQSSFSFCAFCAFLWPNFLLFFVA